MDVSIHSVTNRYYYSLVNLSENIHGYLLDIEFADNPFFHNFPESCCYFSTFFTALTLERLGFEKPMWVFGYRQSTGGHVWCEYSDILIDLTAGQYSDSPSSILVCRNIDIPLCAYCSTFTIIEKGVFDQRFRQDKVYFELLRMVDNFLSLK